MKSLTALEAKNRFGQLIEIAQREPVTITKQGRPTVVVMSMEDFDSRRKLAAVDRLKSSLKISHAYAASQGLTEEKLDELLSDES